MRRNSSQLARTPSLHKPALETLLSAIRLDLEYVRAQGDVIYYREHPAHDAAGSERAVLDFVGGYGTLLLGHNPPELLDAAREFLATGQPNHAQGSIRSGARRLADALNSRLTGEYCCVLANSGCEAVEVASKHAVLETRGDTWIALDHGFHGKTRGALELTASPRYRAPFAVAAEHVVRVPPNDEPALRTVLGQSRRFAGLIYEPVQGEGGVRPLEPGFLQVAAELCAARDIPLIADECQTGLGRTGTFLASEQLGVRPNYVILSKALGGGLAKIAAVLIEQSRYCPEFDLLHSSTFADDEFSCAIACAMLRHIDDRALTRARDLGHYLLAGLRQLRADFPDIIADVRGWGLMVGVELHGIGPRNGFAWRHLNERQLLLPLVASYLLHAHGLRVAPTLSDSLTIRIQPSLRITTQRIDHLLHGLRDMCQRVARDGVFPLTRYVVPTPRTLPVVAASGERTTPCYHFRTSPPATAADTAGPPAEKSAAWLFHLPDASHLGDLDPDLGSLSHEQRLTFVSRWASFSEPVLMDPVNIRSREGLRVILQPILLPVTSSWMLRHSRGKRAGNAASLVQRGVDVAAQRGCDVVALGQFTSIVTRNGLDLNPRGMLLTSGNNYTAALIAATVQRELRAQSLPADQLTLAVMGAAGDIGSTCAALLASRFRRTLLIGSRRAGSRQRLLQVSSGLPRSEVATSFEAVREARVVVCATNCAPFLSASSFQANVILCDASVPQALKPGVAPSLPEATFLPGAVTVLPHGEAFRIPGFPLQVGHAYGCLAEGLLLALDAHRRTGPVDSTWTGRATPQRAQETLAMARRHGFQLAPVAPGRDVPTAAGNLAAIDDSRIDAATEESVR